jgi:multidrug efflux pump subunit AcrB
VVVNDNLVLVDTINRQRLAGTALMRAVTQAGATRFRPILLTSLTTFVGLSPLMMETSLQARFLIPMAVSLAFGVLFSTMVSLILVPSLYLILQDLGEAWAWLIGRGADPEAGPAGPPAV